MWFANMADLSRQNRLYAVDTIGTAGKSTAVRPLDSRADLGNWLIDVLDGLGIAQARILGHSHVTEKKVDPGPAFDWERILRALKRARVD